MLLNTMSLDRGYCSPDSVHLWTWQTNKRVARLNQDGIIHPKFEATVFSNDGQRKAYEYILSRYNSRVSVKADGLIFCVEGGGMYETLSNLGMYRSFIKYAGDPSGMTFNPATHTLLHLLVPASQAFLSIEMYRYTDLIYSFMEPQELDPEEVKTSLFLRDGKAGGWNIKIVHLPKIERDWVVEYIK